MVAKTPCAGGGGVTVGSLADFYRRFEQADEGEEGKEGKTPPRLEPMEHAPGHLFQRGHSQHGHSPGAHTHDSRSSDSHSHFVLLSIVPVELSPAFGSLAWRLAAPPGGDLARTWRVSSQRLSTQGLRLAGVSTVRPSFDELRLGHRCVHSLAASPHTDTAVGTCEHLLTPHPPPPPTHTHKYYTHAVSSAPLALSRCRPFRAPGCTPPTPSHPTRCCSNQSSRVVSSTLPSGLPLPLGVDREGKARVVNAALLLLLLLLHTPTPPHPPRTHTRGHRHRRLRGTARTGLGTRLMCFAKQWGPPCLRSCSRQTEHFFILFDRN
jgi:hypothetical protein